MTIFRRLGHGAAAETASTIAPISFMGGQERRVNSKSFEGGELTAIMGGCKIDLREADIQGSQAKIHVFVMMGGIEMIIPQGWKVLSRVIPVMGGIADKTNPPASYSKELIVDGFLMMGGIEIKNI